MARPRQPVRGELLLCDFGPSRGSEQQGTRPALIVERTTFASIPAKRHVLVAAVTTSPRCEALAFCVPLEPSTRTGLKRRSYVNTSHLQAFSKERLGRRLGVLSPQEMKRVDQALRVILDL